MTGPKSMILAALALACVLATGASANLMNNGSLEFGPGGVYAEIPGNSTLITGWTTTLSGVERFEPAAFGPWAAEDGLYCIDLANYVYHGGGIEQTLATTPGQAYELTFYGSTLQLDGRDGTGTLDLLLNGVHTGTYTLTNHNSNTVWQPFSFDFTAAGNSTTLEFQNNQDANTHFAYLDNVGVNELGRPVPEPGAAVLLAVGLAGVGSAMKVWRRAVRRRRA